MKITNLFLFCRPKAGNDEDHVIATAANKTGTEPVDEKTVIKTKPSHKKEHFRFNYLHLKGSDTTQESSDNAVEKYFGAAATRAAKSSSSKSSASVFDDIKTSGEEKYRQFSINLAAMRHFLNKVPADQIELRTALISRAILYLQEFAPYERPDSWKWQSNPLQESQTGFYARERSRVLSAFQEEIAAMLGVPPENIIPVTDKNVLSAIKEDFPLHDGNIHDSDRSSNSESNGSGSDVGSTSTSSSSGFNIISCPAFCFPKVKRDCQAWKTKPDKQIELDVFPGLEEHLKTDGGSAVPKSIPNIDEVLAALQKNPDEPLMLDISKTFADMLPKLGVKPGAVGQSIQAIHKAVRDALEAAITESLKDGAGEQALQALDEDAITIEPSGSHSGGAQGVIQAEVARKMKAIDERVFLGGVLDVGGQTMLYTGPLAKPKNTTEEGAGVEDKQLTSMYEAAQQEKLINQLEENSFPDVKNFFANSVIRNGYTSIPQQLIENWSKAVDGNIQPILDALKLPPSTAQFSKAKGSQLQKLELDDLLKHADALAFGTLSKPGQAPYLQVLPKATLKLLEALKDTNVEQTFKDNGLDSLLQFTLNRILASMQKAVENKDNFIQFVNNVHLIHEELATLLTIGSPYKMEDFNAEMQKVSHFLPEGFPSTIKPAFYLKNAAMRCLQSTLRACDEQKKTDGKGSGGLNIAGQSDIYFEMGDMLKLRKSGMYHGTNDGMDESGAHPKPTTEEEDKKLDVFLADFHHNTSKSIGPEGYKAQDLIAQVDRLYQNDAVSDRFTVAIDHTIGLTDAQELKTFLQHNAERIANGQLNVVIYRSTQKFDQLGMDNYHGGVMAVVNNGSFGAFNKTVSDQTDQISNAALQGVTHLEKAAQAELNEYRSAIMKTVERFHSDDDPIAFPKEMFEGSEGIPLLQVVPNSDPQSSFVHLTMPGEFAADAEHIKAHFEQMAKDNPDTFPMMSQRDSFGFFQANTVTFGTDTHDIRFTPGLESDDALKNYRDHFACWSEVLTEAAAGKGESERQASVQKACEDGSDLVKLKVDIKQGKKSLDDPITIYQLANAYQAIDNSDMQEEYLEKLQDFDDVEQTLMDAGLLKSESESD
jgi:hypothetical protein